MKYRDFISYEEFKKWLKENKLTIRKFFETIDPKFDLLTGEKLPFQDNIDKFLETDFINQDNMLTWLSQQPIKTTKLYLADKLNFRKNNKELVYFPCQVETLSSKILPDITVIEKYCNISRLGDYLKLKNRFDYFKQPKINNINYKKDKNFIIGIDSRERKPLNFSTPTIKTKFDFGDYCFIQEPYFHNVFIERKSIEDLWGTMSKGFDRFCKEIDRANKQNGYIIVVVDYDLRESLSFNSDKKFSKATSNYIFHNIRLLLQKYKNCQFVFSGSRIDSVKMIEIIGLLGEQVKSMDLQYLRDKEII